MTERVTEEGQTEAKFKPYFVPVFEIGKPLSQEQLSGFVSFLGEEFFSTEILTIAWNPKKGLLALGRISEPGKGLKVIHRVKIPRKPTLSIDLLPTDLNQHYQRVSELYTFADNASSWGDSIALTRTSQGTLEAKRVCEHPKHCSLGKKSAVRKVLERISR